MRLAGQTTRTQEVSTGFAGDGSNIRGMETTAGGAVMTFESRLRSATIVHWAIFGSAILFITMAEMIGPRARIVERADMFVLVFGFFAAMNAAVAFFAHRQFVARSEEILRANPHDPVAAQRWLQGHVLAVAFCESIVLFGFIMRIIGAANAIVWPFYAAGLLLMLLFTPRRP
jgi:hypothetical protein